ncbi:MAG TPA: hypothetical protein VFW90_02840 [Candidatus Saccharimonadales bacterium]|nr:hypothetical protein [Candidatus Saccharimonadales bacterium]
MGELVGGAESSIEAWPPEMREAFVNDMIKTLHEVAEGGRQDRYTPLPVLFEPNFDLAYTLTDAGDEEVVTLGSGHRISYRKGHIGDEGLEFAALYEEDREQPSSWGVRRKLSGVRKYPHVPATQILRSELDVFVEGTLVDIEHIDQMGTADDSRPMAA